jgi:hypothetical protein
MNMNDQASPFESACQAVGASPLRWPGSHRFKAWASPHFNALLRRASILSLCALGAVAPRPAAAQIPLVISPTVTTLDIATGGTVGVAVQQGPALLVLAAARICQDLQAAAGVTQAANGPACEGRLGVAVPAADIAQLGPFQFSIAVSPQTLQQAASTGATRPRFAHLQMDFRPASGAAVLGTRIAIRINLTEPLNLASGPRVTEARLRFVGAGGQQPVGFFALDQTLPSVEALLRFQGSGLLRLRWEVVQPGDQPPSALDLTPATQLSLAERAQQRHWRAVGAVQQHYFSASGLMRLAGPPPRQLPSDQLGAYTLLLRLEPNQPLAPAQANGPAGGPAGGPTGAGFVMPVLRYFVGTSAGAVLAHETPGPIHLLSPQGLVFSDRTLVFTWQQRADIALYRVELERAGELLYAARVLPQGQGAGVNEGTLLRQALPTWVQQQLRSPGGSSHSTGQGLRWRVVSVGGDGEPVSSSRWVAIQWVD